MLKALKYLKPFWKSVIAVIFLIFAQVQLELALPDYMSNIVTNGIQYNGITSPVPEVLSTSTYEHMEYFMSDEDITTFENSYKLIEKGNSSYTTKYPLNETEDIYILNTDKDGSLKAIVEKPLFITQLLNDPNLLQKMNITNADDLYSAISNNPQMKDSILSKVDVSLSGYTSENIEAASIMALKSEYATLGVSISSLQNAYIMREGFIMLLISLAGSLCAMVASYLSSRAATGACKNMRDDVFKKVESFSSDEFSRFSTASLITRTTNDIQQIQNVINMILRIVLFAPMMGITSLLKVLRYPSMASILGWIVLIILVLLLTTFALGMPKFKIIQKLVDKLNLVTREQLSGMLVIRAFNNEKVEEKRFDEVNTDITKVNVFVNRLMGIISPTMAFLMSSVSILIIWVGANEIDAGIMQIGDIMAFLQYAMHVLMSFMIVAMIFIMLPRASVSAGRVFEVLNTEVSIKDPENPVSLPKENATIHFDHVSFKYPKAEEYVLEDIDFSVDPGQTVAFIGSTGSGKSTLINLIPRFFDVTDGAIRIGNIDIRDVKQHDLRNRIGYIPQKATLFSGTIESNLRYADENATDSTIENALEVSQAKEFVSKMPSGIEEPISQGGTNVSGGQKQRLSIARALVKNADIYIFDDTFSALDYHTDALLREALNKMVKEKHSTVFIVAQRISSIMHADKIIVLDQGKIVGNGTHAELMKNCPVYQEIAYSQLSRKELAVNE
mgnify:FL=1